MRPAPCAADLRGDVALSLPAGLPSSVLFLCIRHADCRDQTQAQSLPAAAVAAMKTALKVRVEEEYSGSKVNPHRHL